MTTYTATPATLWTLLNKTVLSGDRVNCADGEYADLSVPNRNMLPGGVLVTGGRGAVFQGILLSGSSGWTFDGMSVSGSPASRFSILVAGGSSVTLSNIDNTAKGGGAPGVQFRNMKTVALLDSLVSGRGLGCNAMDCIGVVISGNTFERLTGDAVNPFGVVDCLIENNLFRDFAIPPGVHGDAVQTATTTLTQRNKNIKVRNNTVLCGAGSKVQGLFLNAIDGALVEGNAVQGTMFNGMWFSACSDVVARDNFIQGHADMPSNAGVRGGSKNVQFIDNVVSVINDVTETTGLKNSGVVMSGNKPIGQSDSLAALYAWRDRKEAPLDPHIAEIEALKVQLGGANYNLLSAQNELGALKSQANARALMLAIVSADREEDRAAMISASSALAASLATYPAITNS